MAALEAPPHGALVEVAPPDGGVVAGEYIFLVLGLCHRLCRRKYMEFSMKICNLNFVATFIATNIYFVEYRKQNET